MLGGDHVYDVVAEGRPVRLSADVGPPPLPVSGAVLASPPPAGDPQEVAERPGVPD